MALPITFPNIDKPLDIQVVITIYCIFIALLVLLPHLLPKEKETSQTKQQVTKNENTQKKYPSTPILTKRTSPKQPPGAPIAKRTKIEETPSIKNNIRRTLFNPIKEKPTGAKQIYDLRTTNLEENQLCISTHILTQISIKNIKSAFEANHILKNTSKLYDISTVEGKNCLSKLYLNKKGIETYVASLISILSALKYLNNHHIALPHSGDGEFSTYKNSNNYMLIDQIGNAIIGISKANKALTKSLESEYYKYKKTWTTAPHSYVGSCKLCRDAYTLVTQINREHINNCNLTNWSDW